MHILKPRRLAFCLHVCSFIDDFVCRRICFCSFESASIGVLGFESRRGLGIFLFITASRTALDPTQPPIQWVPEALSLGLKRPGREADHPPPSTADVEE
jgi:hypothetical protein